MINHYFRYCDDIVILHSDKSFLHKLLRDSAGYLDKHLKLKIKNNWQVFPVDSRGIDFLGYRFFHGYTLLRKTIATKFKRKALNIRRSHINMKESQIINSIMSYLGWFQYANCKNLQNKYINSEIFSIVKDRSTRIGINNPLQGVA